MHTSLGVLIKDMCFRGKKYMVQCSNPDCGIIAHSKLNCKNIHYILQLPGFKGKTCFEIAYDKKAVGLFSPLKIATGKIDEDLT